MGPTPKPKQQNNTGNLLAQWSWPVVSAQVWTNQGHAGKYSTPQQARGASIPPFQFSMRSTSHRAQRRENLRSGKIRLALRFHLLTSSFCLFLFSFFKSSQMVFLISRKSGTQFLAFTYFSVFLIIKKHF